jgi:hypothetical protein
VLRDESEDDRLVRFEIADRLFFVAPHKARVTSHIRGQDGRKTPFVNMEPSGPSDMMLSARRSGAAHRGSNPAPPVRQCKQNGRVHAIGKTTYCNRLTAEAAIGRLGVSSFDAIGRSMTLITQTGRVYSSGVDVKWSLWIRVREPHGHAAVPRLSKAASAIKFDI